MESKITNIVKKKKALTFLIFDDYKYKEVKSFRLSVNKVLTFFLCFAFFCILSIGSFSFMIRYFMEKDNIYTYKKENKALKKKLSEYDTMVANIDKKISNIENYQNKMKQLVKNTGMNTDVAIGGLELEDSVELSVIANKKEKELFEQLDDILNKLNEELDVYSQNYINYLNVLEKSNLVLQSTPSLFPVMGNISSNFGYRISPFSSYRVIHGGLDIATHYGTPIKASAKGIVVYAGYKPLYGNLIAINHGCGYITRYGHCSRILVKEGDKVQKGRVIGFVGMTGRTTGPHVHFEVLINGTPVNPLKFVQPIKDS